MSVVYLFLYTMSETPEAPDELLETFEAKVIAQLTVYATQKDAKGKVKESKTQKLKTRQTARNLKVAQMHSQCIRNV